MKIIAVLLGVGLIFGCLKVSPDEIHSRLLACYDCQMMPQDSTSTKKVFFGLMQVISLDKSGRSTEVYKVTAASLSEGSIGKTECVVYIQEALNYLQNQ